MKTVLVNASSPYLVTVGHALLETVGDLSKPYLAKTEKILLVADNNVAPLYLDKVAKAFGKAGFTVFNKVIPAGERYKNFATYESIVSEAAKRGFCRDDAFVALGGGVTGDLTGFAAATYMRGIRFIQIPTTLLAGIDASIGGKTGLDLAEGKNLVGAFHQPCAVFFDVDTLNSLPHSEIINGMGEGIKYAVLCGGKIADILLGGDFETHKEDFCALCAEYKADVVARDEKEGGLRQLLNLGHTAGHAIEKLAAYRIPHGLAVAMGIKMMARGSLKQGVLPMRDYEKILLLLEKYELDAKNTFPPELIKEAALSDKKMHADGLNVVEILAIGQCRIRKMRPDDFEEYIR